VEFMGYTQPWCLLGPSGCGKVPAVSYLAASAPLASLDRRTPAGEERGDERVLLRGIDGERRKGERDGERDMVALRSGRDGTAIGGMRLVHPHGRLDEVRELGLVGPRLERDGQSVARRAPTSEAARDVPHGR